MIRAGIALLFAIPAGFAGFQAAHALGSLATDNSMLLAILGSIAAMATSLSAWRSVTMSERDTHVTSKFASPVSGQASTGQSMRSEAHTSELQSLMRTSYAAFCLKKNKTYI